jgi:hypothetical protein
MEVILSVSRIFGNCGKKIYPSPPTPLPQPLSHASGERGEVRKRI